MAISFDWYENPVSPDKPEEKKISSAHHRQRTDRHERPPQQDPIPVYAERGGCNGSAGRTITSYG